MNVEILNGNELIIQGGLEAGFSLYTGYPGSPLADYFNILYQRKKEFTEKGIKVVIANSEANAAAMASGAKQAGRDTLVAMKSMGLHVASDALSVGNFANPGEVKKDKEGRDEYPGVVIAVGDDPWSMSTSTPADSRYLYKHLHIPFLEPSTPQELKDWMEKALKISKRSSVYQGLLLTTQMAEGGGRVELGKEAEIDPELATLDPAKFDLSKNVMVPPNSLLADVRMIEERFPLVFEAYKEMKLDQSFGDADSKIGIISAGTIFETVKQALEEHQLLQETSLYKLASSYPLVSDTLGPWLRDKDLVIVVEEKRGFLETELRELCQNLGIQTKIFGKKFGDLPGFPAHGGLNYELVVDGLKRAWEIEGLKNCEVKRRELFKLDLNLPRRLPTFCPGCPHRETLSLLKDLRTILKNEGIDLITHGDVGCYSLSFLPPFKEMHNLSAMGQGGALGAGLDLFTDNPSVVLMGDSTFFHSGVTDISNSVQCDHDITYILLDNDNTAMTGHQMTPASGVNVEGGSRPRQKMLEVVRGLGVGYATEVNPSDRYFYKNLLNDVVRKKGVKVIVSNKECALTFHGRRKAKERKLFSSNETIDGQKFYQINTQACEDCRACVDMTGCPGLTQIHGAYGTKVSIDPQICVADSYCTKIKACPSFELVELTDYHPTKYLPKKEETKSEPIPAPAVHKTFSNIAEGADWRMVVTGVGGSGVTTISRVIAEAAREMDGRKDLDFKFIDQKGLAQRNGNVTGHLSIFKKGKSYGALTPEGSADLYVSPDLLDGSQHLRFLSPHGTMIVDDEFQVPLSLLLDQGEESKPLTRDELENDLKKTLEERISILPMKKLAAQEFGKSVYASAMVLGAAFQKGQFPFSVENMREAFVKTMKKAELDNNWKAFDLGRRLVAFGSLGLIKEKIDYRTVAAFENSLSESVPTFSNASALISRFRNSLQDFQDALPMIKTEYLAEYLHDIFLYDRGAKINQFLSDCSELAGKISDEEQLQISVRTLAKTYWIKDEVFVAHLMVSPIQNQIDNDLYLQWGRGFKKTHINRPHFDLFGFKIEFDINPKTWMLTTMRHQRWLRKVLPAWHSKERNIAKNIRKAILEEVPGLAPSERRKRLVELENVKGYREIRYLKARAAGVLSA